MSNTQTTFVGNLAADPELTFTPSGAPVVNFDVIVNRRIKNRETNEFTDGQPTSWRCNAWRGLAENIAESLQRGNTVIVQGEIVTETWEKDGVKHYRPVVDVKHIGPSLQWATARPVKAARHNAGEQSQSNGQGDPWDTGN